MPAYGAGVGPYRMSVAQGQIEDAKNPFLVSACLPSLNVGNAADIWEPGTIKTYLTSAETLDFVSNNANDTAAGTGMQILVLSGLDGSFSLIQNILVALNGLTPVTTTQTFLRLFTAQAISVGGGGANAGTITITSSSSATLMGQIDPATAPVPAANQTLACHRTIPATKVGHLEAVDSGLSRVGAASDAQGRVHVFTRTPVTGIPTANLPFVRRVSIPMDTSGTTIVQGKLRTGFPIPEKTDVKMVADVLAGNNIEFNLRYEIVIRDA